MKTLIAAVLTVVVVLALEVFVVVLYNSTRPQWERVNVEGVRGVRVEGDPDMPATTWWNVGFLDHFVWKTVVVFEVPKRTKIYSAGFLLPTGESYVYQQKNSGQYFSQKVGREPVKFFALGPDGKEIPIRLVLRAPLN